MLYRTIREALRDRAERRQREAIAQRFAGQHQRTITSSSIYFEPLARYVDGVLRSAPHRYPRTISYSIQTSRGSLELQTFATQDCIYINGITIEVATVINRRPDGVEVGERPTSFTLHYPANANVDQFLAPLLPQSSASVVQPSQVPQVQPSTQSPASPNQPPASTSPPRPSPPPHSSGTSSLPSVSTVNLPTYSVSAQPVDDSQVARKQMRHRPVVELQQL